MCNIWQYYHCLDSRHQTPDTAEERISNLPPRQYGGGGRGRGGRRDNRDRRDERRRTTDDEETVLDSQDVSSVDLGKFITILLLFLWKSKCRYQGLYLLYFIRSLFFICFHVKIVVLYLGHEGRSNMIVFVVINYKLSKYIIKSVIGALPNRNVKCTL